MEMMLWTGTSMSIFWTVDGLDHLQKSRDVQWD